MEEAAMDLASISISPAGQNVRTCVISESQCQVRVESKQARLEKGQARRVGTSSESNFSKIKLNSLGLVSSNLCATTHRPNRGSMRPYCDLVDPGLCERVQLR
eukprot:6183966-Pleurochrysis_carterae.AAC.1